jgi:hypothetical protein
MEPDPSAVGSNMSPLAVESIVAALLRFSGASMKLHTTVYPHGKGVDAPDIVYVSGVNCPIAKDVAPRLLMLIVGKLPTVTVM